MVIDKTNMKAELSVYELQQNVLPYLNSIDQNRKNKLTYAATHLGDEITSKLKSYSKEEQKLLVEYAAKKEDGDFKLNEKGDMVVNPKKLMEYSDAREKLALSTNVTIDLYYCKDAKLIDELPIMHQKKLNNFLFEIDFSELETAQGPVVEISKEYKA